MDLAVEGVELGDLEVSERPERRGILEQPCVGELYYLYVGTKQPVMSYATRALMQLAQYDEVVIKARGLAISRAVDVVQIITKRFGSGQFKVKSVRTDTEWSRSRTEVRGTSQRLRSLSARRLSSR